MGTTRSSEAVRCNRSFTSAPWCIVGRLPLEVISLISSLVCEVTRLTIPSVRLCFLLSGFYTLQQISGRCISVGVRLLVSVVTRSFKHEPSLYQHSEVNQFAQASN
ncbi:Hypothetical_protein [Hexamita inflata]|uniref:Hypothetical_protein n=1 Tax=Hexamita inflata TaxID=28002 RepID=A0AA86R8Y3_9EUKA|nr:Hypothetical protein HINF_LOCUS51370 [Hexamita inflata]